MSNERLSPGGESPEPTKWDEPQWTGREAWHRTSDALDAEALARYIAAGHPYVLEMRSPNAVKWIEQGQYVFFARIDASNEFWRIQTQLKRERQ